MVINISSRWFLMLIKYQVNIISGSSDYTSIPFIKIWCKWGDGQYMRWHGDVNSKFYHASCTMYLSALESLFNHHSIFFFLIKSHIPINHVSRFCITVHHKGLLPGNRKHIFKLLIILSRSVQTFKGTWVNLLICCSFIDLYKVIYMGIVSKKLHLYNAAKHWDLGPNRSAKTDGGWLIFGS